MNRMSRWGLATAWLLSAGAVYADVSAAAPQRETRQQHVIINVLDRDGGVLPAVGPEALTIKEDGIAREVLSVAPAAPPSHIVLLLDDSSATSGLALDLRAAVQAFLTVLPPDAPAPLMRLATFGDRPTTRVEFTTSPAPVAAGTDRIFARPGSGSTLLEALVETSKDLRTRKADRPVIVAVVAEGGPELSDQSHQQVADALRSAGVALWAVVLQDRGGQAESSPSNRERAIVLGDTAKQSGGFTKFVLSKQGLEAACRTIATALASALDVTYGRPDSLIPPSSMSVALRSGSATIVAPAWVRP